MTGQYFALLANDNSLAQEIRSRIDPLMGRPMFGCPLVSAAALLGHDTEGLLLVAATDAAEVVQARAVIQEISLRQLPPRVVLLVPADAGVDTDSDELKAYGVECLHWPTDAGRLERLVRADLRHPGSLCPPSEEPLGTAIGRRLVSYTPSLGGLVNSIALAAFYDVPLLITGETGTGKTHLARLVHDFSPRKAHRFLVVSCGALAANLIESELFGHAKGAFTGADRAKEGKFAAAGRGTLLLDEIDTLGLDQQANLLRVLETGEFEPVGSNQTQVCAARIIVASNWDLEEAVEAGKFRRDLYYRLNVMAFHLPPLRDRVQDIAPLARGLTAQYNAKFRKNLFAIHPDAVTALEKFPWPGNIRQLENVIQQAVLVSQGPELLLSHLPPAVQRHVSVDNNRFAGDSLVQNRQEAERLVIQRALLNSHNCRTEAAHALGISRVTLYKKMKKYGLMNGKGRHPEKG